MARALQEGHLLRRTLLDYSGSERADLLAWADRIKPPELGDVPPDLLTALPTFSDGRLDDLAFTPIPPPLQQPWLPRQPNQLPAPWGRCPRRAFDLMPESTQLRLRDWVEQSHANLRCIRSEGISCARSRPDVLVISQGKLLPWARGLVWDFRQSPAECGVALDYSAALRPTLNTEFFRRRLEGHPNQQILSMIVDGVRYQADVELQGVFVPHLVSLPYCYASVRKELDRLEQLDWYEYYAGLPFWHVYSNAQGATPRKLEQRWRRTTEGSGPRRRLIDRDGVLAWLLNNASRALHVPRHFASERRPRC